MINEGLPPDRPMPDVVVQHDPDGGVTFATEAGVYVLTKAEWAAVRTEAFGEISDGIMKMLTLHEYSMFKQLVDVAAARAVAQAQQEGGSS